MGSEYDAGRFSGVFYASRAVSWSRGGIWSPPADEGGLMVLELGYRATLHLIGRPAGILEAAAWLAAGLPAPVLEVTS